MSRFICRLQMIRVVFVTVILTVPVFAGGKPTDLSLRINQNFNGKYSNRLSIHGWMFEHMNQSMSRFQYYETGIGPKIHIVPKQVAFSFIYRQGFSKQSRHHWEIEKAPSANIDIEMLFDCLTVKEQLRFEYRVTPLWHNLRIKNFVNITALGWPYSPYIAWESFYENETASFALQRFFLGIGAPLSKDLSANYYIRFDVNTEDTWDLYRICVGLKISFNFSIKNHPKR